MGKGGSGIAKIFIILLEHEYMQWANALVTYVLCDAEWSPTPVLQTVTCSASPSRSTWPRAP